MRYYAHFFDGKKEKSFETDDLSEARKWMLKRFKKCETPEYAMIFDSELDKNVFTEVNEI